MYDLGSHLICGQFIDQNLEKGISYLVKSFLLGYLYAADHLILSVNKKLITDKQQFFMG